MAFLMAFALAFVGILLLVLLSSWRPRRINLPPGPKGIPIFGSLFQMPSKLLFTKLSEWAKEYGGIFSYNVMGQTIIVLSRVKEAADVLDRMSAKTSDRPSFIKAGEFLCRDMEFTFLSRGERWRNMRRAAHESLNLPAVKDFRPILKEEAVILVQGLLDHPELPLPDHMHRIAASVGWRCLFGQSSIPLNGTDPSYQIEQMALPMSKAMLPGGSIVDLFPPLKPIIARFSFLRKSADDWFYDLSSRFERAYSTGSMEGQASVVSALKSRGDKLGLDSHARAWVTGSLFFAAEDTAKCTLLWFIYAILLHPNSAIAARQQLNDVIGDRPPSFSDQEKLPQIEAMVKEVLRWRPPAPLGVAHAVSEDFEYNEYVIPRGAIILDHIYDLGRDPNIYPQGDLFDPSRFIDENGKITKADPDTKDDLLAFGHGRRICVGKDLAIDTLWISFAYLLWAFDFKAGVDSQGRKVILSEPGFEDKGTTLEPIAFPVHISPRYADLKERLSERLGD